MGILPPAGTNERRGRQECRRSTVPIEIDDGKAPCTIAHTRHAVTVRLLEPADECRLVALRLVLVVGDIGFGRARCLTFAVVVVFLLLALVVNLLVVVELVLVVGIILLFSSSAEAGTAPAGPSPCRLLSRSVVATAGKAAAAFAFAFFGALAVAAAGQRLSITVASSLNAPSWCMAAKRSSATALRSFFGSRWNRGS